MSNVKITKLKLHWWQELIYLIFVMVVPVVIACCEIFSTHSTAFKITFSSVGAILLVIILVRRFVFKSQIEKLQEKCLLNEHDYEIDVGNKDKLRKSWAIYNMIILAYNAIVLMFSMFLAYVFIAALSDQLLRFKSAALIILSSVFVGVIVKFSFFAVMTRSKETTNASDK